MKALAKGVVDKACGCGFHVVHIYFAPPVVYVSVLSRRPTWNLPFDLGVDVNTDIDWH